MAELLRTPASANTLERLCRGLDASGEDMVTPEDMREAFASDEESDAIFFVFVKDLNGDLFVDEFEASCNEIHLEKVIEGSFKDLDSVITKLDKAFSSLSSW